MRRLIAFIILAAAAVTVASCATMSVSYHTDRAATFERYATYQWGPPDNLPVGDPRLDNNPFFRDYLMGAVEKRLAARGYVPVKSGSPDLLVHYHASVNQKVDVYQTDKQYGYCYGNCEPTFVDFELGTLMLDIVDAKTNKVIWRGWAQDSMTGIIDNQKRLEKQVTESVTKMMVYLPVAGTALREPATP